MSSHQTRLLARDDPTDRELVRLLGELDELLERLEAAESTWSDWLAAVAPGYRASARNIVHYWAIRQIDLRELQARLAAFGLSSLGRSEPHVEATLRIVRSAVVAILEETGVHRNPRPLAPRKGGSYCGAGRSSFWDRHRPAGTRASWSPCPPRRRRSPI